MKIGKDGAYHTSFRFEGHTYSVRAHTEAELYRKIGQKKAELKAGMALKKKAVTVQQYAYEWLDAYHNGGTDYKCVLDNHIVPELGGMLMRDVTESVLQDFLNRKAQTYSKSYLIKMKLTMNQMFRKAKKNHIIIDNPAEDLELPECKQGTRRSLTDEEREVLLDVTENHRGFLFVRCMLYCGIRPQEAAVLQWKHVIFGPDAHLHIEQARKRDTGLIGPPKSRAGYRDIPIPTTIIDALAAYKGPYEGFVCAWDNKPITQKKESIMWANIKREMDIAMGATVKRNQIVHSALAPDLDLYCLRHTYCTDLQKAGVPINIAKEWMGHEDISVTANIYTHSASEATRAATESLNAHHQKQEKGIMTEIIRFPSKRTG